MRTGHRAFDRAINKIRDSNDVTGRDPKTANSDEPGGNRHRAFVNNLMIYRDNSGRNAIVITLGACIAFMVSVCEIRGQNEVVTRIKFASGPNVLHGQISIPKNKKKSPLLIVLPGSGNASYQTNYKKFLGRTIEEMFKNEFALLYFDKPGVGESDGEWWNQDFYEQAENSLSALKYAVKEFPIDKSRVGIVGHSQGGWLAQIIANKYPKFFRFGISMAGPAVSVFEQFVESENSKFLCEGTQKAEAKEKAIRSLYSEWLRSDKYGITDTNLLHFRIIKGFDPRPVIRGIKIPFLFVFAEKDEFVYPAESLESITEVFGGKIPRNVSTILIPKADHSFRLAEKCFDGDFKSLKQSEVLNPQIKDWVAKVGVTGVVSRRNN